MTDRDLLQLYIGFKRDTLEYPPSYKQGAEDLMNEISDWLELERSLRFAKPLPNEDNI